MPYITRVSRNDILVEDTSEGSVISIKSIQNEGDLNFAFTSIIDNYLSRKGHPYANINGVIGALECAKLELYRRVAAPYEDKKIIQNGDAYSEHLVIK